MDDTKREELEKACKKIYKIRVRMVTSAWYAYLTCPWRRLPTSKYTAPRRFATGCAATTKKASNGMRIQGLARHYCGWARLTYYPHRAQRQGKPAVARDGRLVHGRQGDVRLRVPPAQRHGIGLCRAQEDVRGLHTVPQADNRAREILIRTTCYNIELVARSRVKDGRLTPEMIATIAA